MKLGVCVPYRNREAHLKEFIPRVGKHLQDNNVPFCMYFAHQCDDKQFNRGTTKNVAAKAAFEDGCDYIVWHDIDMIPEAGVDYSHPGEYPIHLATNISQMDYQLKYFEYFGGAVLFSREQVEKTNGYSNGYWGWGMEDDDLFWRCHLEKMLDSKVFTVRPESKYFHFEGNSEYLQIPVAKNRQVRGFNSRSHTISVLCRAFQQPEKNQIYLIGDVNRRYVEYPIVCVPGYDYSLQFNNSKAFSMQFWNTFNQYNYMWAKRYDNQWTWVTCTFDATTRQSRMYINGKEVCCALGQGSESPREWIGRLKMYGNTDLYIGMSPSIKDSRKYFKGDVAELFIFNEALTPKQVAVLHEELPDSLIFDLKGDEIELENHGAEIREETIEVPENVLPYRRPGRFKCLWHEDEGLVNGGWKLGEITARNELRYQTAMQQGKIDYKQDGIAQLDGLYQYLGTDSITPWAKMVNMRFI